MEREKCDFPMTDYNFDKPIKISYIFEDSQSDKTDKFENLQLPKNPGQYSSAKNNNNKNSATELLNTTLSADHNCFSNISFHEMETRLNMNHDSKANTEGDSNRDTQNRHIVISSAISNPHMSLREKVTNITLEHNYLTSNENTQHLHLLDTVSENLIMIFKYYHFYSIQYANTKNINAIENYLNYKAHYYKKSYRVTVEVLLPQEHNHVFIRNFINRTIDISKRKSASMYHNMSISSLKDLVYSMIQWAKLKKNMEARKYNQLLQLLSRQPPPLYSIASSNTRQQAMNVQAPVSLGTLEPPAPSVSNCCPASNTYAQQPASGPSVALLRPDLAVQPPSCSITNINTGNTVRRPPPIALPPSEPPLPPASNSFININTQQPMLSISLVPSNQPEPRPPLNNSSNNNSQKPTNLPLLISPVPSVLSEQQATQTLTNVVTQQQMTRAPVSVPVPSESNSIITNSTMNGGIHADLDNSVRLFSTGPPGSEISISIDGAIANVDKDIKSSKKNRKSLHNNQTSKKRKTDDIKSPNILHSKLSTRSALRPHKQNQVQQNNRNCDNQNQPPVTSNVHSDNTTMQPNVNSNQLCPGGMQNRKGDCDNCQSPLSRSESRDSGFGSPILSTLTPTNDYNTAYSHCTNQDLTPEIIHVTSMHPDAVFIANGACRICGKTTKNKCIACYKEYYCGTKCQTADWPFHMLECRPRFLI